MSARRRERRARPGFVRDLRQAWEQTTGELRATLPSIAYARVFSPDGSVRTLLWSGRWPLARLAIRRSILVRKGKGADGNRHGRRAAAAQARHIAAANRRELREQRALPDAQPRFEES